MFQSNPVGVELLSHTLSLGLCYVFCAQKSRTTKYTFPPLIYSVEGSVGFGQREEVTQHIAKLQLSVSTRSPKHFVKTCMCVQGFQIPLTLT